MPFTLRVLFTGLMAGVPNTDETRGMRVLMIDGRAPGVASNGASHVSHIPAVYFQLADLAPACRQPAYYVHYRAEESTPRGMWILNGDDLEIRFNGHGLPDAPVTILRAPSPRDFALVPHLQAIYPEVHGLEVREECFDTRITRLRDVGLVGRMRLQAGMVGAYDGHDGQYISADEFMFTHSPSRHRRRLASCVVFETTIGAPLVELYSRQRGKGLTFRPQDGQEVELIIENEPPSAGWSGGGTDHRERTARGADGGSAQRSRH